MILLNKRTWAHRFFPGAEQAKTVTWKGISSSAWSMPFNTPVSRPGVQVLTPTSQPRAPHGGWVLAVAFCREVKSCSAGLECHLGHSQQNEFFFFRGLAMTDINGNEIHLGACFFFLPSFSWNDSFLPGISARQLPVALISFPTPGTHGVTDLSGVGSGTGGRSRASRSALGI